MTNGDLLPGEHTRVIIHSLPLSCECHHIPASVQVVTVNHGLSLPRAGHARARSGLAAPLPAGDVPSTTRLPARLVRTQSGLIASAS